MTELSKSKPKQAQRPREGKQALEKGVIEAFTVIVN